MKNTTRAAFAAMMIMSTIAIALLAATATFPTSFGNHYPPMKQGWQTGTVTGRVTATSTSDGLGGAYVSIVNASNNSVEYFNVTSDPEGYYQIIGVNATVDDNAYQIYANLSPFGEGISNAFGVSSGVTSDTSVVIFARAADISMQSQKNSIIADNSDNIEVTAYIYDATGNSVADGTSVWFTIGEITGVSAWTYQNGIAMNANNGSFSSYESINNITADTMSGVATVQFGWVPEFRGGNNTTIHAYVADNPTINSSIRIYFQHMASSWTGYVVDSYGIGYGGVTVTLHLQNMTNGEIYNLTAPTSNSDPFIGLYIIDNIVLPPETAWAYADASAHPTENMTIYGRSNNYSLNKTTTSSGFIVLHVPPPDAIYVTADPETILVGGDTSIITAQLYLNGQPYHRSNINVTFTSDNNTVATLPVTEYYSSDLYGSAITTLTSNMTIGWVNITADSYIMHGHNISNSTMVKVVGWGTVSGIVTDQNKVGIPYANVTLWYAAPNLSTAGHYDNTKIVLIPENPQQSNDGRTAAVGMYTYYRVPWGLYNVTAEKEGHVWYSVFTLGPGGEVGTATHNIAIPDYAYTSPAFLQSTPTPTVIVIPTILNQSTTSSPGFEVLIAIIGLIGVAYLLARKKD